MTAFRMAHPSEWQTRTVFLWVWDGYVDCNPVPTAALVYLYSKFPCRLRRTHVSCSGVRNGRSKSSKVIDFGTNRKRVCNFLLVINGNLDPILPRFRDIAGFLLRTATRPLFQGIFKANLQLHNSPSFPSLPIPSFPSSSFPFLLSPPLLAWIRRYHPRKNFWN